MAEAQDIQFALGILNLKQRQDEAAAEAARYREKAAFDRDMALKADARAEEEQKWQREQFKVKQEAIWNSQITDALTGGEAVIDRDNPYFTEEKRRQIMEGVEVEGPDGTKVRRGGGGRVMPNPLNPNQYIVHRTIDKDTEAEFQRIAVSKSQAAADIFMSTARQEEKKISLEAMRAKANNFGRLDPSAIQFASKMASELESQADANLRKALETGGPAATRWVNDKWAHPDNAKIRKDWENAQAVLLAGLGQMAQSANDPKLTAALANLGAAESVDEVADNLKPFRPAPIDRSIPVGPRAEGPLLRAQGAPPIPESSPRFSSEAQEAARRARLRELLKKKRSGNWTPADKAEVEGIYRGQQQSEEADIERIRSQAR